MANFISKLFGGSSQKRDTTYTGYKPPASQAALMGGPELYAKIRSRLAGEDVGYGKDYASIYSSPIIKNMRSQFEGYTVPELDAELSATGRRRGSGGFAQKAQAYKEQGLSEGDVFSRLQQRNEDAQREDVNDAFGRLQNYVGTEGNLGTTRANFDYTDFNRTLAEDAARRTAKGNENMRALTAAGSLVAAPFTGGASLSGLANTSASRQVGSPYDINQFNPRNYIGYGKSGNSLNTRLAQRNARLGRA